MWWKQRWIDRPCRFDVVTIHLDAGRPSSTVYPNAFRRVAGVPELRRDPVTGRWVIISTDRQKRPNDFRLERAAILGREQCPFCPGHEAMTPPEIVSLSPERRRAEFVRLGPARGAEQVPGAAGRGHARSRRRRDVRSDERHRRARSDHRDARSRSAAGGDGRIGDRARACGRIASGFSISSTTSG